MLMLDIGAGLGGASAVMRQRGWDVVTMDINPAFGTDVVGDMRTWSWKGARPDLVWCSPPCDEFARFGMPCFFDVKKLPAPDMSLVEGCKRIIDECQPRHWIIENVKGSNPFISKVIGKPRIYQPYYLWGKFPPLGNVQKHKWVRKENISEGPQRKELRAKIPDGLTLAIALAIEGQKELYEPITASYA